MSTANRMIKKKKQKRKSRKIIQIKERQRKKERKWTATIERISTHKSSLAPHKHTECAKSQHRSVYITSHRAHATQQITQKLFAGTLKIYKRAHCGILKRLILSKYIQAMVKKEISSVSRLTGQCVANYWARARNTNSLTHIHAIIL